MMQCHEMPLEMNPHHSVPLVFGHGDQHPVAHESCVVDDDVEPTEGVDGAGDHVLARIPVGHIGHDRNSLTAGGDDLVGHGMRRVGVEVVHHHACPLCGERA